MRDRVGLVTHLEAGRGQRGAHRWWAPLLLAARRAAAPLLLAARRAAAPSLFAALISCNGAGDLTPVDDSGDTDVPSVEDLLGILIQPERVTVPVGEEIQLEATGLMADRSSRDLTHVVKWSSADESVASVSDELDKEGLINGVGVGSTEVVAELDGVKSVPLKVKVTDAELLGLTVEPAKIDLAVGKELQLVAQAAFSDGTRSDASAQVRWITGDGAIAQIASGGKLVAAGTGSTKIHADWNGTLSPEVDVKVVAGSGADLTIAGVKGEVGGNSVTLTVTVENKGAVGVSDFWVDAFVDPPGEPGPGDFGDDFAPIDYIGANATAKVTFTFDLDEGGEHEFWVVVDSDGSVEESNESNNSFSTVLDLSGGAGPGPNLEVGYFDFIIDDTHIYYVVDIYNSGTEDVEAFYVDLYVDRSSAPLPEQDGDQYVRVNELARGKSESADFLIERACVSCRSWVFIDSYNYVPETDENDNYGGPITVSNSDGWDTGW